MTYEHLVLKPSYIPFLGKSLKFFVLAVVILVARSMATLLPELVSLIVNVVIGVFTLLGMLALIIGTVQRNSYTYTLDGEGLTISRQLFGSYSRRTPYFAIADVQVSQSMLGRLGGFGDVVPITKSGFGLAAQERYKGEVYVTEMTDVPNPNDVAETIMDRAYAAEEASQTANQ